MQAAILPKDVDNLRGILSRVKELSASLDLVISNSQSVADEPRSGGHEISQDQVLQYAKEICAFRRKRGNWLPQDLFGEPAWDILLELFIMRMQGQSARVKTACIASGVPATTALRWINLLERKGLVSSYADTVDHRVRWICLNDEPYQKLFQMLADQIAVVAGSSPLGGGSDAVSALDGVSAR
ncbi:MAG: hypothetical protein ACO1OX_04505 [Novosphingobium sp.]